MCGYAGSMPTLVSFATRKPPTTTLTAPALTEADATRPRPRRHLARDGAFSVAVSSDAPRAFAKPAAILARAGVDESRHDRSIYDGLARKRSSSHSHLHRRGSPDRRRTRHLLCRYILARQEMTEGSRQGAHRHRPGSFPSRVRGGSRAFGTCHALYTRPPDR